MVRLPFNSSITRFDLNLALKFLLCLDMILNPLFHTDCSLSNSLKSVRKSVLIYETIIYLRFIVYFLLAKILNFQGSAHFSVCEV